jgi:hypothetical protein
MTDFFLRESRPAAEIEPSFTCTRKYGRTFSQLEWILVGPHPRSGPMPTARLGLATMGEPKREEEWPSRSIATETLTKTVDRLDTALQV